MKWSFRICEIRGTQVRVHLTFFIIPVWIGFTLLMLEGPVAAATGVAFIFALFGCVVLHEFGHATAARYYGIRTPDITLLPIGGLARLERIPRKPVQEFVIAVAGPLVNVAIAALLLLFTGGSIDFYRVMNIGRPDEFVQNLLMINVILVLFNLIPAFPMDGGRVFRALLASFMGYAQATQLAANIGQFLAMLLGIAGLYGNPWLIVIAIFIFMAGGQEANFVRIREATAGLLVSDAMITRFRTLPEDATLKEAVEALIAGSQHDFPVLDAGGGVVGVLLRTDLIAALAEHGQEYRIHDIVKVNPPPVHPDWSLDKAFEILSKSPSPTLPVMLDADGQAGLVGILTRENVGEMIMVQSSLATRRSRKDRTREPVGDSIA